MSRIGKIIKNCSLAKKSDNAVAGIFTAVIIIGIIISMLAVLQTVFVPDWMEQKEAEHMEEVANQFVMLKYAIDVQSTSVTTNSPITTSITLGSKELPFFSSQKSFGNLEILPDRCYISLVDTSGGVDFSAGIIKYSSKNSYFMNQDYVYEAGAIINSQPQGDVMSIIPAFKVYEQGGNYKIKFKIINIESYGGKTSSGGYGTCPIQTDYYDINGPNEYEDIQEFTITTDYLNSWKLFFRNQLIGAGLTEMVGNNWDSDNPEDFRFVLEDSAITVKFNTAIVTIDMEITEVKINAQIAPGWVE